MELSKEEIIFKLNTDANYLIRFIIDNNENAVVQNMKANGAKLPVNYLKEDILESIYANLDAGNAASVVTWLDVPYEASSTAQYTEGLGDYFRSEFRTLKSHADESEVDTSTGSTFGTLLLGVIGQVAGMFSGGGIFGTTPTDSHVDHAPKKNNTWIWVLVGVVVVVVLYFVFKKKGK